MIRGHVDFGERDGSVSYLGYRSGKQLSIGFVIASFSPHITEKSIHVPLVYMVFECFDFSSYKMHFHK